MSKKNASKAGQQTKKVQSKRRSLAEWIALIISGVILAILIGLLTYQYITTIDTSPVITVDVLSDQSYQEDGKYYVPIEVKNIGGNVAENVRIEVRLSGQSVSTESGQFQIRFLAEGEISKGTVVFTQNPRKGEIQSGVISFLTP